MSFFHTAFKACTISEYLCSNAFLVPTTRDKEFCEDVYGEMPLPSMLSVTALEELILLGFYETEKEQLTGTLRMSLIQPHDAEY